VDGPLDSAATVIGVYSGSTFRLAYDSPSYPPINYLLLSSLSTIHMYVLFVLLTASLVNDKRVQIRQLIMSRSIVCYSKELENTPFRKMDVSFLR
jgi:hypothetical protein